MAKTPPEGWCACSGLGALLASTRLRAARRRATPAGRPAISRSPSRVRRVAGVLAALTAPLVLAAPARANDAIFPAEGGAADRIGWEGNYFVVDGEPVVLSSAEIHYARVPRELWRDRLVKAKRAGMNTISTYSFWNAHEPAEGAFDFSDNLDLDAWLSLIEELGMYAIVRPGPYNCAEWLSGGIPQWITAQPGMQIRTDYAAYVAAADAYYDAILPIVAEHQLHRGGSVLLVQLENEHPDGWGTDSNPFLAHLYDKARALGLEVPLFHSGLHHSSDPAGTTPFGDRSYPWFSTEFWSGSEPSPHMMPKISRKKRCSRSVSSKHCISGASLS